MRLVIADNDPDALDLAVLDLGFEGHDIVGTASDGWDAVAVCERLRPDTLVVDYRMPPGINGVEVARRVLRDGLAGKVVLYTNYTDPDVMRAAERAGALYLLKGDLTTLRAAVA